MTRRRRGLPGSWTSPLRTCPAPGPGGTSAPGLPRRFDAAFRCCDDVGFHAFPTLGARSRGLCAPCVRFATPVARTPRNTRFRLVANLYRAGLASRWDALRVSDPLSLHLFPPLQASPGATQLSAIPLAGARLLLNSRDRMEVADSRPSLSAWQTARYTPGLARSLMPCLRRRRSGRS